MESNVLSVPLRTTEQVPLAEALSKTIEDEFYQSPRSFQDDIRDIARLRHDIVDISANPEDLGLLHKYYVNLHVLLKTMPDDLVGFTWCGAKLRSLQYEAASVMYNIAAMYSLLAVQEDVKEDRSGMKMACSYFQLAAGSFGILLGRIGESDVSMPPDLSTEAVSALKHVMIAQAQEKFWQYAANTQDKDSILARLAMQTSTYYKRAKEAADKTSAISQPWKNHITVKVLHFEGVAYYRQSLVSLSKGNYGEQVAFLKAAVDCSRRAAKSTRHVASSVVENLQVFADKASEALKRAENDNDFIYLEVVPSFAELPRIKGADMVKETPPEIADVDKCAANHQKYGRQLFSTVIPYQVFRLAQSFKERQLEHVKRELVDPLRGLNSRLGAFLQQRNLPSAIDALERPRALPDSIRQCSETIKSEGGVLAIVESLKSLETNNKQCVDLLNTCKSKLSEEEKLDNEHREREGSRRWTRPASNEAAADLVRKLKEQMALLDHASVGDATIRRMYDEILELLRIFDAPDSDSQLKNWLPPTDVSQLEPEMKDAVTNLSEKLKECRILEESRDELIRAIEFKSDTWNIMEKVIAEYKRTHEVDETKLESFYEAELQVFNPDSLSVFQQQEQETQIEKDVAQLVDEFEKLKSRGLDVSAKRRQVLQEMEATFNAYKSLKTNISSGLTFYSDYYSNLVKLEAQIDEYVEARAAEAKSLIAKLEQLPSGAPLVGANSVWTPGSNIKFG